MTSECYGATRPRQGSRANEDGFWIWRPSSAVAALCDGAGSPSHCAGPVLRAFARQIEGGLLDVQQFPAWSHWLGETDASLAGGIQTTFVGGALVERRLLGAYTGDSRAYLVNEHGCRLLSDLPTPPLGSGHARARPLHEPLDAHDTVLLLSDGAWTPLPLTLIHRAVMAARLAEFADLPATLLDLATRHGGAADDMTAVAMRTR